MKHIVFSQNAGNQYKVAILIKEVALTNSEIKTYYHNPLVSQGVKSDNIICVGLKYNEHGKAPAKLMKEHLDEVLKVLDSLNITTVMVADSNYFKALTKVGKVEPHHGYIKPCVLKNYSHINVILSVNYQALFYNPAIQEKLDMSIKTVASHLDGTHQNLGTDIIHSAYYPANREDIEAAIESLHQYPVLTCDIETFSLEFHKAGIGTISFAWDEHNGIAFAVDKDHLHALSWCKHIKELLYKFFSTYKGKVIYHGGTFDIKVLIYELFMGADLMNYRGLIVGLETMYRNVDCTKVITYLATNSAAGNKLSLKHNAFEFAGNYAKEDIEDITKIPTPELLEYNLVDCLSTWYVYKKNYPIMVQDNQLDVYNTIMHPSMKVITHMELIGMPMDKEQVFKTKEKLLAIQTKLMDYLRNSTLIKEFEWQQARETMIIENALLKRKIKPVADFYEKFNPASNKQTQKLVYETMGFDVIDKTDTGQPAVGQKTLQKLLNKLINQFNITDEELSQ